MILFGNNIRIVASPLIRFPRVSSNRWHRANLSGDYGLNFNSSLWYGCADSLSQFCSRCSVFLFYKLLNIISTTLGSISTIQSFCVLLLADYSYTEITLTSCAKCKCVALWREYFNQQLAWTFVSLGKRNSKLCNKISKNIFNDSSGISKYGNLRGMSDMTHRIREMYLSLFQ